MANFNKVMLMGNLTRDPELRYLPSGTPVCEFGLAVNRIRNDPQTGERREQTCFVDLVSFGKQADTIGRYMRKGRPMFIEGRLDFQSWETPDGQKRSKLRVVIENFQFVGGRQDEAPGGTGSPRPAPSQSYGAASGSATASSSAPASSSYGSSHDAMVDDDDIPF